MEKKDFFRQLDANMPVDEEEDPQTRLIIGAAIEVHRVLGPGFLEAVYQDALAIEFERRDVPYRREVMLPIHYKGVTLGIAYRADFLCFNDIIVELKTQSMIKAVERAQVYNYLKATGYQRGLLLNFGETTLRPYRQFLKEI